MCGCSNMLQDKLKFNDFVYSIPLDQMAVANVQGNGGLKFVKLGGKLEMIKIKK